MVVRVMVIWNLSAQLSWGQKVKAMAVTLSDDEVSDHEFESDQEGNFMAFTAITVVSEIKTVDENSSDEEL